MYVLHVLFWFHAGNLLTFALLANRLIYVVSLYFSSSTSLYIYLER